MEFEQAMIALTRRLLAVLAEQDDQVRSEVRALAEAVLHATGPASASQPGRVDPKPGVELSSGGDRPAPVDHEVEPRPIRARNPGFEGSGAPLGELTLGQSRPQDLEPRYEASLVDASDEIALLEVVTRCRMKAEGARWAAIRHQRIAEGVDFRAEIAPRDREVIEKAGAIPGCFLWTNTANFRPPEDLDLMESLAECFEVMAEAVVLVLRLLDTPRLRRNLLAQGLELLAETQSALRVAILRVGGSSDSDQFKVYHWIRQVANAEGHFIHRYMKLEDPADPARVPWTRAEVASMMSGFEQEGERDKKREARMKTLRFHASRLGKTDDDHRHWNKIVQTVHEAVILDQIPPSSVEIREALSPVWDQMPEIDDPPAGFSLVLREIDNHLAAQDLSPSTKTVAFTWSREIREVAGLLSGRAVLMIGGHRQPHAQAALAEAFDLAELIWFDAKEHGSNEFFRPSIARSDVALVLLAIRWSSHSFGEVKVDCDRLGKPLVRLPAGYNPQQVAMQILAQCSDQLRQMGRP